MKKIIFFGFLLTLVTSCYKEVDLSVEINDVGPVVSAFFANDSLLNVYLLKAVGVNGFTKRVYITDAVIKLLEDGTEVENLMLRYKTGATSIYDSIFNYQSENTIAKVGKTYQLKIITSGGEQVTSETFIPEPIPIISVDTTFTYTVIPENNTRELTMNFGIRFKDPEGKNYYRFTMKEKIGNDAGNNTIKVNEMFINFSFDPDTIFSFFGEDEENEYFSSTSNNFLIFNDQKINGQEYEIKLSKTHTESFYGVKKGEFKQFIIELQSITEDGYNYLKAIDLQKQKQGMFTELVLPFTNVNNGVGIFTGYSVSQKIITLGEYPIDGFIYN